MFKSIVVSLLGILDIFLELKLNLKGLFCDTILFKIAVR